MFGFTLIGLTVLLGSMIAYLPLVRLSRINAKANDANCSYAPLQAAPNTFVLDKTQSLDLQHLGRRWLLEIRNHFCDYSHHVWRCMQWDTLNATHPVPNVFVHCRIGKLSSLQGSL